MNYTSKKSYIIVLNVEHTRVGSLRVGSLQRSKLNPSHVGNQRWIDVHHAFRYRELFSHDWLKIKSWQYDLWTKKKKEEIKDSYFISKKPRVEGEWKVIQSWEVISAFLDLKWAISNQVLGGGDLWHKGLRSVRAAMTDATFIIMAWSLPFMAWQHWLPRSSRWKKWEVCEKRGREESFPP